MSEARAIDANRKQPVYGLDIVRFAAASLVVFYHLGFKAWALEGSSLHAVLGRQQEFPAGYALSWCGWIGVQVFFVVSGAVIAYSTRGVSARGFARRRAARLLPAVLIAVAIALPIAVFLFGAAPAQAILLTLKTMAFVPFGPWIIGQFWTIPIELAFYALVWTILASGAPARAMDVLSWLLGVVSVSYWAAVVSGVMEAGGRLSELLLLQHGIYFTLGMLCARLGGSGLGLRDLGLSIACVIAAAMQVRTAARWEMGARIDLSADWLWAYALWLCVAAAIAAAFRWQVQVAAMLGRFGKPLRLAGLATYPLYLVHIHVGGAILLATARLGVVPALILASAGSVAVALAIAGWFEPPLHAAVDMALRRLGQRIPRYRRTG